MFPDLSVHCKAAIWYAASQSETSELYTSQNAFAATEVSGTFNFHVPLPRAPDKAKTVPLAYRFFPTVIDFSGKTFTVPA